MKRLKKTLLAIVILIAAITLVVLVVVNPFGPSPLNRYQTDGNLSIKGLTRPVNVIRDEKGMAYLYAENVDDLLMAQGFVTAMDRLFQMEVTKLYASGRIGEMVGITAMPLDVKMRTIGFRRHAQAHCKVLDEKNKHLLQKYVDGVNAFIGERSREIHLEFTLAGIKPQAWTIEDALTILYFMGWDSAANLKHEVVARMLVEKLGHPKSDEIFAMNVNPAEPVQKAEALSEKSDPVSSLGQENLSRLLGYVSPSRLGVGSNNWVVNGDRTRSGKPILANDPHLDAHLLPGPWYPCALILPDKRLVGVGLPGTPGIAIGRSDHVAFGITNAYGDAQDLYIETVDPRDSGRYLEGDRSIPFTIIEENMIFKDKKSPDGYVRRAVRIRSTHRGPVVTDVLPSLKPSMKKDNVITLRWSAFESMAPSLGFEGFFTSRDAKAFRKALKGVNQIGLNYLFADSSGNIGWQVTGRLPIRSQGSGALPYTVKESGDNWQGWIPFEEMPHAENPKEGWIGTANHKTITKAYPYYYSNYYAPSFRQRRLTALISPAAKTSAEDHWRYQRDTYNMKADRIAPVMAQALSKYGDTRKLGEILASWDNFDDAAQAAPTVFHGVFNEFARLVYTDDLGEDLSDAMLSNIYFWEERLIKMMASDQNPWFDDIKTTDTTETRDILLHRAALNVTERLTKPLGADPQNWLWGAYHRYGFVSPIMREGFLAQWLGGGQYPADGSGDTLNRSKYAYDKLSDVASMASLRMVADLGDEDKVLAVIPGGVTGRQFHPHMTDQIEPYMQGTPLYWWFSDKEIQSHADHTLTLEPLP